AGDADGVEPGGDVFAFVVHHEIVVAAAGADDDGAAGVFVFGGREEFDLGFADVGDAFEGFFTGFALLEDFVGDRAGFAGGFAWPHVEDGLRGGGEGKRG